MRLTEQLLNSWVVYVGADLRGRRYTWLLGGICFCQIFHHLLRVSQSTLLTPKLLTMSCGRIRAWNANLTTLLAGETSDPRRETHPALFPCVSRLLQQFFTPALRLKPGADGSKFGILGGGFGECNTGPNGVIKVGIESWELSMSIPHGPTPLTWLPNPATPSPHSRNKLWPNANPKA